MTVKNYVLDTNVLLHDSRSVFAFADNNLGGSPDYLRELCEALIPLNVRWGCAVTYNILAAGERLVVIHTPLEEARNHMQRNLILT